MIDTTMNMRLDNSGSSRMIVDAIGRYALDIDAAKYTIIAINNKTGKRYKTGFSPMSLREAQTCLSKLSYHPLRSLIIERV